jgi:hypothetical protein
VASGLDGQKSELIIKLWHAGPRARMIITELLNKCWESGTFPTEWKTAQLVIILKDMKRDKMKLNSYRPISLIPTMGKLLKQILVRRVRTDYEVQELASPNQYGFRNKRSTEDAIMHLKNSVRKNEKKHVMALFLDIEGAYDNLWWPAILTRLTEANCSTKMKTIMKNYFHDRKAIVKTKFHERHKIAEKGCPQGSVM